MDIAVLANPQLWEWQRQALQHVVAIDGVELSLVIDDSGDDEPTDVADSSIGLREAKMFLDMVRDQGLYSLVLADEKLEWTREGDRTRREFFRSTSVSELDVLANAEVIKCAPELVSENWNTLPDTVR